MMITGDTLFANSVGRCDLYGGNVEELISSIKRLSALDKDTCIYPGHDVSSTLGEALENVSYIFDF
jgi:glyoxylase-like metal-dependent hydrolase (beta-lactamase superfamily II)